VKKLRFDTKECPCKGNASAKFVGGISKEKTNKNNEEHLRGDTEERGYNKISHSNKPTLMKNICGEREGREIMGYFVCKI
jgi:hypothetical protein